MSKGSHSPRRVFCLTVVLLFVPGSIATAQVTDDFEGTYSTRTAPAANGVFTGPCAPAWLPWDEDWSLEATYDEVTGYPSSGSAQRIAPVYGEGYLVKTFTVTPDRWIGLNIQVKTESSDEMFRAVGWVDYGLDVTGQNTDWTASPIKFHQDEADSPSNDLGVIEPDVPPEGPTSTIWAWSTPI